MHPPSYRMLWSVQENAVYLQIIFSVVHAQTHPGACCRLWSRAELFMHLPCSYGGVTPTSFGTLIQGTIIDLKNHK